MKRIEGTGWLRIATWPIAAVIWLAPWVANHFSDQIDWGAEDFIALGVLLFCACATFELVTRLTSDWRFRLAAGLSILLACFGFWLELAVGVFGPD